MYRITTRQGVFYRCSGRGANRKSTCKNMLPVDATDGQVFKAMASNGCLIREQQLVPGHDHAAALEDVSFRMRQLTAQNLTDDEFLAQMMELRAEQTRLRDAPPEPDEVRTVETGRSYADERALKITDVERNDWLRKNNITVYALRSANPADVFVREITCLASTMTRPRRRLR
jgi:hypothetical protein